MSKPVRLSGLQKQALSLYRALLRAARQKEGELGGPLAAYARSEFDRLRGIDRKNYQLIEHHLRRGKKQLEVFQQADVTGLRLHTGGRPGVGSGGAGAGRGAGAGVGAGPPS